MSEKNVPAEGVGGAAENLTGEMKETLGSVGVDSAGSDSADADDEHGRPRTEDVDGRDPEDRERPPTPS